MPGILTSINWAKRTKNEPERGNRCRRSVRWPYQSGFATAGFSLRLGDSGPADLFCLLRSRRLVGWDRLGVRRRRIGGQVRSDDEIAVRQPDRFDRKMHEHLTDWIDLA